MNSGCNTLFYAGVVAVAAMLIALVAGPVRDRLASVALCSGASDVLAVSSDSDQVKGWGEGVALVCAYEDGSTEAFESGIVTATALMVGGILGGFIGMVGAVMARAVRSRFKPT